MRKFMVFPLAAALVATLAAPAGAETERYEYESANANAYWHSRKVIEPGVVDRTTWYIGIYWSSDSIWSDVYRDTVRCRRLEDGRRRCRLRSSVYGEITSLDGATFEIDKDNLDDAILEAVYPLRARDTDYNFVGDPRPTKVVTRFEGLGQLWSDEGVYTTRTSCSYSREEYTYKNREAEAYGSVGSKDLGETYNAYLGWGYTSQMVNNRCEDGEEPPYEY